MQWIQPSTSPALSFDISVTRTDLVSGGDEIVVLETAWPAVVAPGGTETYTITEPLPTGSYSVSIAARDSGTTPSTATTNTFAVAQVAPQVLQVSGQKFNGINVVHPTVSPRVSLSWTVLPGVNDYYVWIEKSNGTGFVQSRRKGTQLI